MAEPLVFVGPLCWSRLSSNNLRPDRVLYTPERLSAIAAEAAKDNSIFSLDDRLGLVHDAFALSKAGLAKVSSALTLVDLWKNEKEREAFFFGLGDCIC